MSDQSTPTTPVTTPNASKPSDTPKPKRASKSAFTVTDLARARLRARGIKSDDRLMSECKVVRGILRANFALVAKHDKAVRAAKDEPNDRRPWPTNMGAHTHAIVVKGLRK